MIVEEQILFFKIHQIFQIWFQKKKLILIFLWLLSIVLLKMKVWLLMNLQINFRIQVLSMIICHNKIHSKWFLAEVIQDKVQPSKKEIVLIVKTR